MEIFWIDASVFIQAKRGLYAFDLLPSFWEFLEREAKSGVIRSSILVYDELVPKDAKGRDDLANWAVKMNNEYGLFVTPDADVVAEFRPIADHIHTGCDPAEGDGFLRAADPWLVAHAKQSNGIVVTEEKLVGPDSRRVQIPNICTEFGVGWIVTTELLRRRKFKA